MNCHVLNEYLKYSSDAMLPISCKLFHLILNTVIIPEAWSKSRDIKYHDSYRGITILTLKAPIATKVLLFSRLLKCLRSLFDKQSGPRSVCYVSTLFASILNLSVMLGNYLQQTTSADNIFRCFLGALRVKLFRENVYHRFKSKIE